MKPKLKKETSILFTVEFNDAPKSKPKEIPGDEIQKFIDTETRKFTVRNADGQAIFVKTFKG